MYVRNYSTEPVDRSVARWRDRQGVRAGPRRRRGRQAAQHPRRRPLRGRLREDGPGLADQAASVRPVEDGAPTFRTEPLITRDEPSSEGVLPCVRPAGFSSCSARSCCFRRSHTLRHRSPASSGMPRAPVLPGVTVEAASPALIEKVRTAVTDGSGQYTDRRPAAGHLHGDVHAAGLQHGQARGDRADRVASWRR